MLDKKTEKVVIIVAPCFPIKRPKKPAINDAIKGKKIIDKYIIKIKNYPFKEFIKFMEIIPFIL